MTGLLLSLPAGTNAGADDPRALVAIARQAEAAGIDGVVVSDHVVIGPRLDRYPWGRFPFPAEAPWLEPLTVLTAIGTATARLRLATGILIVPLRPATLLAKTVATLDRLAPDRLDLGVGAGWQEEEFTAQGVDHARRGQLLTDHVAACRALWTDGPATFSSPSVSFTDIWCEPRPAHRGGPPILFAGTPTARNVARIVELGDGWIPIMGTPLDGIRAGTARIRAALAAAGRDDAGLRVRAPLPVGRHEGGGPDLDATLAQVDDLEAAGATDVTVPLVALARDPAAVADRLGELGERWRRARGPAPEASA